MNFLSPCVGPISPTAERGDGACHYEGTAMNKIFIFFLLLSLTFLNAGLSPEATASERPLWWERAKAVSSRAGYTLINIDELRALYESGKDFLLVDVRPAYEYRDGHLPKAVQLEFDLSEQSSLKPDKSQQCVELLGPDKNRAIVIYCRNYS